jgi:5-methylcytosine-specific restriction enzyme subunit McrC
MLNLFEYQNKVAFDGSAEGLEAFLDSIWQKRERFGLEEESEGERSEAQRFIQFLHKTKEIKSNKYVGVIHFEGHRINLLPKIFYQEGHTLTETEATHIQSHMLWWLSYCRKIKFPNYQASQSDTQSDFFEVLIYLFAKFTRNLLNNSVYQRYEEESRETAFIKGRLNTSEYIQRNVSRGRWHKLNCTYDAFLIDNEFNRIIKYVATLLFRVSTQAETKKYLREILFMLDEVTDTPATAKQCHRIQFNPLFSDFETVRDYCSLFLSNSISFDYKNDLKLFAFLLPMEYVFEDFLFGFIDRELPQVNASSQRSDTFLDEAHNFRLRPDLWIETTYADQQKTIKRSFIADTKYKIVYSDGDDLKHGISQSDLYQMLAYAMRFKVDEIKLFYPNTLVTAQLASGEIIIQDALAGNHPIRITTHQLPIIRHALFNESLQPELSLAALFEDTRMELKKALEVALELS